MHKNGITKPERKKLGIYVAMGIFGTIFFVSIKDLFLQDLMDAFTPETRVIFSMVAIIALFYFLDMK